MDMKYGDQSIHLFESVISAAHSPPFEQIDVTYVSLSSNHPVRQHKF